MEFSELVNLVLDHGQPEYIVSVHWLKTALAVREECRLVDAEAAKILYAAVNRFVRSRLKRRQVLRTAHQSINFVDKG